MKRYCMPTVLVLSLLFNIGVVFSVGLQTVRDGKVLRVPGEAVTVEIEKYLQLTPEQIVRWREQEKQFVEELENAWLWMRHHRENMVREIFSDKPDLAVVEMERQAITELQEMQQRQVIEQLLSEKEILDERQRHLLASLLLESGGSMEEVSIQLHQH
jgi:hypothetical protein